MGKKGYTMAEWMYQDRRNEELDWTRAEGPDPRDPRGGCQHRVERKSCRIANAHMVKYKCQLCEMVVLYVPKHGSSGNFRKATPLQKKNDSTGAHNPEGRSTNPANLPEAKPAPKAMPKAKPKSGYPPDKPDKKDPKNSKNKEDSGERHNIGTPPVNSDGETPDKNGPDFWKKDEPPTWDGKAGTLKAYQRMLKKWSVAHGINSSSEDEDSKTGKDGKFASPLNSTSEWNLLTEKLAEVESDRKRKDAASGDASMRNSGRATPATRGGAASSSHP